MTILGRNTKFGMIRYICVLFFSLQVVGRKLHEATAKTVYCIGQYQRLSFMRQISAEQFRYLGTRRMVYLKAAIHDGEPGFVIYGADGTPLEAVDAIETAMYKVAMNGLSLVAVH